MIFLHLFLKLLLKNINLLLIKNSELVEYIDNTFKDSYNKIYNEYLSTNKFDNAILEYKNKNIFKKYCIW